MAPNKLIKNFSSLIIAQVIYKAATFIMMIFTARFLGPDGLGKLSYASSFVWAFLFLADFGFSELFIRDVSKNKKLLGEYVNNIITLKIFVAAAVYLVIAALAFIFSSGGKFFLVLILGLSVIFDSFMYFLRSLFRVRETMEYEGILLVIESVLKLGAVIIAIHTRSPWPGVFLICGCILVASAANLIINWAVFAFNYRNFVFSFNRKIWLYLLKNSFPFALVYILCLFNFRINIMMLSLMEGDLTAGMYAVNYKLLEQVLIVPITLSYASLPLFSRSAASLDQITGLINKIIRILLFASLVILLVFYVSGARLIGLIFGKDFQGAGKYLFVISSVLPFFFVKPILEKVIYAIKKQNELFLIYCFGILLNIILGLIMIPRWKITGISAATFISEFVVVITIYMIYKTHTNDLASRKVTETNRESRISNEIIY